jgi:FkbM family methyltransferase
MTIKSRIRNLIEPIRRNGQFDVQTAMAKGRVIRRTVAGDEVFWLITNKDDEIQCKQLQIGYYEFAELEQLRIDVGPCESVVDVGANIGNHSVFFINRMGCSDLIAIEPFKAAFAHLLANLSLNHSGLADFRLFFGALGATAGTASIVPPSRFNIGLTKLEIGEGSVHVSTGDEVVGARRVDLIKIDVEGMELEVLSGLTRTIATQRPAIYVEASDQTFESVLALLSPLRYRLARKVRAYESQFNLTMVPK